MGGHLHARPARSAGGARADRRLLLLLTVRSDELHRAHPFRRTAARWEQQRLVERLELERLGPQDVAAQIEAIVGERPDGELIEFIAERSEGIPLFVEELLRAVRDGRVDHDYLPPSLRDLLLARAELLSTSAQHLLRVVSAGGRWVPDGLLATVAELPAPELNAGLREAVEQQLLVVDATGRGFGFRHELARAAIHDDLLPGERAQLHEAYAEAIEDKAELAGSDLDASSMLAYHWLAAHDLPRALPASVRAGRAAAAASAPSAAQRHYELALELWLQVPDAEQRAGIDHAQLLEAAAWSAARAGAVDRGLALVDEALSEIGYDAEPEHRARLLVRRAELLVDLGRDEEGLTVLEEALGLLSLDSPSLVRTQVLVSYARSLSRVDQIQRANEMARRALEAAQAVGATEEKLEAQLMLAQSMVYAGGVDDGLALLREVEREATGAGLSWIAARSFIGFSDLLLMLGRYEEAIHAADDGMKAAEQGGLGRTMGAFMRGNKAEALFRSGRWEEALVASTPGAEASGVFAGTLFLVRAELFAASGQRKQAELDLREARRHLRTTAAAQFALPLELIEAQLARADGDLDRARDVVTRALAREDTGEEQRYRWPLISLAARIEAERVIAARDAGELDVSDPVQRLAEHRAEAERMAAATNADRGHLALVRAEQARALSEGEADAWADAVSAIREMNEPIPACLCAVALRGGADRGTRPRCGRRRGRGPRPCQPNGGRTAGRRDRGADAPCAPTAGGGGDLAGTGHGCSAGRARAARPHSARGRGAPVGGGGAVQQPDRREAVHLPQDGERPRVEHPLQARGVHARGGRRARPPARPRPGVRRLDEINHLVCREYSTRTGADYVERPAGAHSGGRARQR